MSATQAELAGEASLFLPQYRAPAYPISQPGVHALIVGVSRYRYLPRPDVEPDAHQQSYGLGLAQLTCAALSGHNVYRWLLDADSRLPLPLSTCRVLLSAQDEEAANRSQLSDFQDGASLQNFLLAATAWRADVARNDQNIGIFYFAGHGFERRRSDHVLVLDDVGEGIGSRLAKCVEVSNLVNGMAPSTAYPTMGLQQLFFFDSCRLPVPDAAKWEDKECSQIWDVPTVAADARSAMEFSTAKPGVAAFAIRDEETIFSRALIECLTGGAGEWVGDRWQVNVSSLHRNLGFHLAQIASREQIDIQAHVFKGPSDPFRIVDLLDAPQAELLIEVDPEDLASSVRVEFQDFTNGGSTFSVGPPIVPHPLATQIRAGKYLIVTTGPNGSKPGLADLSLPERPWRLRVR
jgi:hypothetical protein